jgi:hypothetical protein
MIKLGNILNEVLLSERITALSPQDVADKKLFGPVYHGTDQDTWEKIATDGFKIFQGHERSGDISHGYEVSDYYGGIPAPIHHLGFGVYFTTMKAIAKRYNHGTTKGMPVFYLDVPRLEVINWGSPRTMMKWWMENGYDFQVTDKTRFGGTRTDWGGTVNTLPAIREERLRATINLTNSLKERYDAVWYKGKSMFRLLDGDQVVVFDPSRIYRMDLKLAKSGEVGAKVRAKVNIDRYNRGEITVPMGTKGIIVKRIDAEKFRQDYPLAKWVEDAKYIYDIKFEKGGYQPQILDKWIDVL